MGDEQDVIASASPPPRWAWAALGVQAVAGSVWTWRFVRDGDALAGMLAGGFVAVLALGAWALATTQPATLALTDDALLLRRRWRPRRVARSAVRAVHGDVPGRPTWSEYVVVETDAGPLRLGGFDVGVPVLVDRIQAWAGVGEQPADPDGG